MNSTTLRLGCARPLVLDMTKLRSISILLPLIAISLSPIIAVAQSHLPPCPADPNVVGTNCIGTNTHSNEDKFIAEVRDGRANGQGTYTWADGRKYVGEFRDDRMNGQGTKTGPDGRRYVGGFKDGKQNGQGTLTAPEGNTIGGNNGTTMHRTGAILDDDHSD